MGREKGRENGGFQPPVFADVQSLEECSAGRYSTVAFVVPVILVIGATNPAADHFDIFLVSLGHLEGPSLMYIITSGSPMRARRSANNVLEK